MYRKILSLLLVAVTFQSALAKSPDAAERPNIVLIMVDDMGFSDLGCYGSEIETPHIDALAKTGLRFSQFYNCAKCETTRSTLMSGRYYPEVNRAELNNCMTIAQGMKRAGYDTIMTGKWHLKSEPTKIGFDQYFGHLSGATNFFIGDDTFRLGTEPFEVPKEGFYTTDANTDYAIKFLKGRPNKDKPFFLYIAHNAPHYPLQAPKEDVQKYRGKYKAGWDKLRKDRFQRQLDMGLFPEGLKQAERPDDVPAWDSLSDEDKDIQELMMATFAAMVDRVDQNLGRLVEHLKSTKQLENTLILFWSDNGACPFQRTKKETWDNKLDPWNPKSYWVYDKGWAHACNTPFREYKQNQHEGGICTPMVAHWPAGIKLDGGSITRQPAHLVDIMATCLDLGETDYPQELEGKPVGPPRGLSMKPIFETGERKGHEAIYFSFYGKNNALRAGDWKLVNINNQTFELYNIAKDRTELTNLAKSNPEKFKEMKALWDSLSKEVGETNKKKGNKKKNNKQAKKAG